MKSETLNIWEIKYNFFLNKALIITSTNQLPNYIRGKSILIFKNSTNEIQYIKSKLFLNIQYGTNETTLNEICSIVKKEVFELAKDNLYQYFTECGKSFMLSSKAEEEEVFDTLNLLLKYHVKGNKYDEIMKDAEYYLENSQFSVQYNKISKIKISRDIEP
ncbi:MAG: hypothetical protein HKK66_10560 [Chlorobiaceae bacterium]|nr:hypothetical protein [Chlorobiaceae bacterium]